MKTIAIIQARVGSSRLPGKALLEILDKPLIEFVIERVKRCPNIDRIILATGSDTQNLPLKPIAQRMDVDFFAGSEEDVLDRFYQAAKPFSPDAIVRITGDCPLIDPQIIDETIGLFMKSRADYVANCKEPIYPDGLDVEVFTFQALEWTWQKASQASQREHVTLLMGNAGNHLAVQHVRKDFDFSHLRWCVDNAEDFALTKAILERLYPVNPGFGWLDVLSLLTRNPEWFSMNAHISRNEGLTKSISQDTAAS